MRAVTVALGLVLAAGVAAAGIGFSGAITPGSTGGASDRPLIYWLIAPCFLVTSLILWPLLLSWFVDLDLPNWHRECLSRTSGPDSLEAVRRGRTILDLAQSTTSAQRLRLAGAVLGYGLFYVVAIIPMPIFFGVAATIGNGFATEEAVPLALAFWIPVLWCASLLLRSRRKPAVLH